MKWDLDVQVSDLATDGKHYTVTRPIYHPLVYKDGTIDCSGLQGDECTALHKMDVGKQLAFISDYLQHPLRYAHKTTFIHPDCD